MWFCVGLLLVSATFLKLVRDICKQSERVLANLPLTNIVRSLAYLGQ